MQLELIRNTIELRQPYMKEPFPICVVAYSLLLIDVFFYVYTNYRSYSSNEI